MEIVSKRVFEYPLATVYQAWTDPEHLKNWWGPRGFANTFHEFDLRPSGRWRFTMHGPEKGNYENEVEFKVVEPEKRLEWDRITQPHFYVSVVFDAISNDATSVVLTMKCYEAKLYETLVKFVPEKNEENFERLEVELKSM